MKTTVLGVTTHYQQIGTGFPIVLLHGWGCDWQIWAPVIPTLTDRYQLIIPDLPIFGQSKLKENSAWNSFEYADWLAAFIEQVIPSTPFILAGHSFGGKIAAIYAAEKADELLKGLVIIDASGLPVQLTAKEQFTQTIAGLLPRSLKKALGSAFKKTLLNQLQVATDYQQASEHQQAVLRKIVRENISHQLAQIELPSLVLWGKQDYTTPLEKGELFAELMPNAELVVFEQSGHYPFIDETELFMSVLEKYIQQQTKH
jgi:pimeloyl-ACP methyl ester carboxylesterase